MIEKAKTDKNSEEWVRGLLRYVQLRTALHGYETSVRFLKEQPWPKDLLGSSVLNLFYAQSLVIYAHNYSWEIRKREKVESKAKVDLKAWTMEQLFEAAHATYQEVFTHRQQLGKFANTQFKEYLSQNNFPRKIRSTLRDSISYLWAQLLADTTGWRPEHSNEIYQLDLKQMLAKAEKAPKNIKLTDPAIHPLIKIVTILKDLEAWHTSNKRTEAAFEAHLERLRQLHRNFKDAADRKLVTSQLEKKLESVRKFKWWSVGMAALAEFTRAEDTHDNQVRARKIALAGQKAYPESIGAQRCLNIIKSIEAPSYQVEAMASDAPAKQSIRITHKNLEKLFFKAYAVDLKKHIESSDDYNVFLNWKQLEKLMRKNKPAYEWTSPLPATPDFKNHKTFLTPAIKKAGFYVVMSSARQDFSKHDNKMLATNIVISDLVLAARQEQGQVEVNVLSGASGRPVKGAKVYLYKHDWNTRHKARA